MTVKLASLPRDGFPSLLRDPFHCCVARFSCPPLVAVVIVLGPFTASLPAICLPSSWRCFLLLLWVCVCSHALCVSRPAGITHSFSTTNTKAQKHKNSEGNVVELCAVGIGHTCTLEST